MTIRDLADQVDAAISLNPAARTASANGSAADLRGYDAAMVVVAFGTWTDGTHTPTIEHSVDNSTWNAVATTDLVGTLSAVSSSGGSNTVQRVSYVGERRYVRVVMTDAGATTGALSSAIVMRGHPHRAPLA